MRLEIFLQNSRDPREGLQTRPFFFQCKGGRCETCQGDGVRKIEMHFLSDVFVTCEDCEGNRFNAATLEVKYKGKSISDILKLTVAEAKDHFSEHPKIFSKLQLLSDVGLDYLAFGAAIYNPIRRRSPENKAC